MGGLETWVCDEWNLSAFVGSLVSIPGVMVEFHSKQSDGILLATATTVGMPPKIPLAGAFVNT